jgi:Dolichyl-phosphate-mannose-protein mannosyltransferase
MRAAITSRDHDLRLATDRLIAKLHALKPRALRARFVGLSPPQRTMFVLITALLAIVLATYHRYGFTVDEFKGFYRAKRVFAVLLSGQATEPSDIDMFHGTAPDVIALALQKAIPQLSYDSRHLIFALFGIAGIYYVYRLAGKFVGEWTGVFAALFLAITPMWFGYMFINHKDIPFATLLVAASYYSSSR